MEDAPPSAARPPVSPPRLLVRLLRRSEGKRPDGGVKMTAPEMGGGQAGSSFAAWASWYCLLARSVRAASAAPALEG